MSATTERGLSSVAGRIAHAIYEATLSLYGAARDDRPSLPPVMARAAITMLETAAEDLATLYQQNEANLRYIERLEAAESKHLLKVAELKTRLSRAAEEMEALTRLTSHAVGDAAERHLIATRARTLLDLTTPLPPRSGITPPSTNGALHNAATH